MIEGSWPFIVASYALTVVVAAALALIVMLRLRHWSQRAKALPGKAEKAQ